MLKTVKTKKVEAAGGHFAIVASQYNALYVDSMVGAAQRILNEAGAATVKVVRVPGAFEIPLLAAKFARRRNPSFSAILCLGVILRGETAHAQLIGETVTRLLGELQVQHEVPVIHEVLLLENKQQAEVRCLNPEHNRGAEAAQTALEMARTLKKWAQEEIKVRETRTRRRKNA